MLSVTVFLGTIHWDDKQRLLVIFFGGSFLVGMSEALSMEILFAILFSSMGVKWIFTCKTVNHPILQDSSMLYRDEVFFSSI